MPPTRRRTTRSKTARRKVSATAGRAESPSSADRGALAARIQAAAEHEIAAVERILAALGGSDPAATEAAARTLASLARTLRELVHLDVSAPAPEPDDELPRDLDELRRALAQRLDRLIADAKATPADAGDAP
jgi:hypothetical protein